MLTKAVARYIRVSPARRVWSPTSSAARPWRRRWRSCSTRPQVAARQIEKVLRSAVANAEHNHQVRSLDDLRVNAVIDGGPSMKRDPAAGDGPGVLHPAPTRSHHGGPGRAGHGSAPARRRPAARGAPAPEWRPPNGKTT